MLKSVRERIDRLFSTVRRPRRRKAWKPQWSEGLENRCLLTANLNLLGSGLLIYGGSAVDNQLDVSFDGTNYTFSDPSEPINVLGGLTGLDTDPDPNIVTFDPTAIGGAFTQIVINPNAGDDATTISSMRPGEGLDVRDAAGQGTDVLNIIGDIGTMTNPANSTVILRAETLNVGGDIFTNGTKVTFGSDLNLTGDVQFDTSGGIAEFQGAVDGASALTITNASTVRLNGAVGSTTQLTDIDVEAFGRIHVGGTVQAAGDVLLTSVTSDVQISSSLTAGTSGTGSISVNAPVTRFTNVTPVTLTSSGDFADTIAFLGELNGNTSPQITMNAGMGTIVILGDSSGLGHVSLTADSVFNDGVLGVRGIDINAPDSVTIGGIQASTGNINIDSPLTDFLGASSLVSAAGTIHFSGDVTQTGDLLIRRGTTVSVGGSLTVDGLLDVRRGSGLFNEVTVGGAIDAGEIIIESDFTTINLGGNLTSGGDITLNGGVVYTGTGTLTITGGGAAGDDIIVRGEINAGAPNQSLTINANNGAFQNLGAAPNVGIGQTTAFQNVTLTGGILTTNAIRVTGGSIIFNGGALRLNGDLSTTTAGIADVVFRPRAANGTLEIHNRAVPPVSTNMTVSGLELGRIQPGFDNVIFGGPTTSVVTLFGHSSTGPFVTPNANRTRFEAATINIKDHVDQKMNEVRFVGDTINFDRSLRGSGDVRVLDFGVTGTVTVNGAMSFPFGLPVPPMNVFFDTPGSDVTVTGNFGHHVNNLTVTASTAMFPAVTAIDVSGDVTLNAATTGVNGGVFSQTGDITLNGNLSLTGNTTVKVPGGRNLVVTGNILGNGNNLVIRGSGGAINQVDIQGDATNVGQFRIDSGGAFTANSTILHSIHAGNIVVRANAISAGGTLQAVSGNVHLLGTVDLTGDTQLLATSASPARYVQIDGTINGNSNNLDIDAARVSLLNTVSDVSNMNVSSVGPNYITAPITVSGAFQWDSNGSRVLVLKDVTAGVSVTFDTRAALLAGATLNAPTVNNP